MSTPTPPPPQTQPTVSTQKTTRWSFVNILLGIVPTLIGILYCYGAARLSYTKYRSILWAILAFITAPIYYPLYAVFLHTDPQVAMMGGRRMKW